MEWRKQLGSRAGADGGWRDDFPLSHHLPASVEVDCSSVRPPIHPMFFVRLRTFIDWHRFEGREVRVIEPTDSAAGRLFRAMAVSTDPQTTERFSDDIVLPVSHLADDLAVETAARQTREILEYELTDVSALGQATYMAVAELCGNAIEHGMNELGAYVAALRITEPRRQVSVAVSDLGIGIPEHIRQRFPEWAADDFAIAQAVEQGVSGLNDPHRGNGFEETFEAALTSALHAARIDIHSANGFVRIQLVQDQRKIETFPAAAFRRGTWISYDLVSVRSE